MSRMLFNSTIPGMSKTGSIMFDIFILIFIISGIGLVVCLIVKTVKDYIHDKK